MQVTVTDAASSEIFDTTQLLHVKAILEIKYLVCGAKKLL